MRRIAVVLWVSCALAACASPGGGNNGTSSSSSSGSSGGGSSGLTGSSSSSGNSSGSSPGTSSRSRPAPARPAAAAAAAGRAAAAARAARAAEPDNQPCQLGAGYGFCCLGTCTDSLNDPMNCGQCYNVCQFGQTCSQGNCTLCQLRRSARTARSAPATKAARIPSEQCVDGICVAAQLRRGLRHHRVRPRRRRRLRQLLQGPVQQLQDTTNCGGCGLECPTGAACVQGACSSSCVDAGCPTGTACSQSYDYGAACLSPDCTGAPDQQLCAAAGGAGGACCSGSCMDTLSDPLNCGQCYNACQPGELCVYGSCEAVASSCASSQVGTLCQQSDGGLAPAVGRCRQLDFQTDPNNCGSCGSICSAGPPAWAGQCALRTAATAAVRLFPATPARPATPASRDSCVTRTCDASDVMEPCSGPGAAGPIAAARPASTPTRTAPTAACAARSAGGTFCLSGICTASPTCGAGNSGVDCPLASNKTGVCCSGRCVDTRSDSANCEGCGVACPVGQICNAGYYPPCSLADGGTPPSCYDNGAACPPGTLCSNGRVSPTELRAGIERRALRLWRRGGRDLLRWRAAPTRRKIPANCGTCGTFVPRGSATPPSG